MSSLTCLLQVKYLNSNFNFTQVNLKPTQRKRLAKDINNVISRPL